MVGAVSLRLLGLLVLVLGFIVSADIVLAQPCHECGNAALIINGDVLTSNGVQSSQARNTVAFVAVPVLSKAVNGSDAQLAPHLTLEGTDKYDPQSGGRCDACRLYAADPGGCPTCPVQVRRGGLISGQVYWADGWQFALPDLATALGGTLTWNDDLTVFTITVPQDDCPTCLLQYRGSSGVVPGMPRTGSSGTGLWLLAAALVLLFGLVQRFRASPRPGRPRLRRLRRILSSTPARAL